MRDERNLCLGPQGSQDTAERGERAERQLHQKHLLSTYVYQALRKIAVSKTKADAKLTLWWGDRY